MNLVQDAPHLVPPAAPLPVRQSPGEVASDAPVVSVCIANWNCREMLRACLSSLIDAEQGVPFEVVVVDNASTDGAADMVADDFPQVRLVRNSDNVGFSKANNQAAAIARGRFLFFLNNDTEVPPLTLSEFVAFTDANPGVGMVGPRLRGADGVPQISYRTKPTLAALLHRVSLLRWTGLFRAAYTRYRRGTFDPTGVRSVEALMGAAVFLPRRTFEASGRWDERYRFGGEDLDLSAQVGRHGRLVYFSSVEILHYGRVSSRANVGFAQPNVAVGYVHYFRKAGANRAALVVYKTMVTLDTPVQLVGKLLQAGFRLATGRPVKAKKSWLSARGLWTFFRRDLPRFWRA